MEWTYAKSGAYNDVYFSTKGDLVLKIQKDKRDTSDTPERSVRLWNEINPTLTPYARVANSEFGRGWTCPFIEGHCSNDEEISNKVLDIFNQTGRILVDAAVKGNCITKETGEVVCVDIGMALLLDRKQGNILRKSGESDAIWKGLCDKFDEYFEDTSDDYPKSVNIIKALLLIVQFRPFINDASFLRDDVKLINLLANAYASTRRHSKRLSLMKLDAALNAYQTKENVETQQPMPQVEAPYKHLSTQSLFAKPISIVIEEAPKQGQRVKKRNVIGVIDEVNNENLDCVFIPSRLPF